MRPSIDKIRHLFSYAPLTGKIVRKVKRGKKRVGDELTHKQRQGYIVANIDGCAVFAHRMAWALHYGEWPSTNIDHINGDRGDNRIANLRLATPSQNNCNRKKRRENASGLAGANFDPASGRFRVRVAINGRRLEIGRFATAEEAQAAYLAAVSAIHGDFAFFNGAA